MSPPDVSVVVADLDSEVLFETLSALRWEGGRVEVIVAGRDAPGIVRRFPEVAFLETADAVWPSRARNLALACATAPLVAILDADCVPEAGWLRALRAAHVELGPGVLVGGGVRIDAESRWAWSDNLSSFHAYLPSRRASQRPYLPALNLSGGRDVFTSLGGFDEALRFGEDLDLTLRARRLGTRLVFRPEVTVWHRPERTSRDALLAKARGTGAAAAAVRRRHGDLLPTSALLGSRLGLRLGAPLAALSLTALACARARSLRGAPAVFAAKLAWCAGAAS